MMAEKGYVKFTGIISVTLKKFNSLDINIEKVSVDNLLTLTYLFSGEEYTLFSE